MSRSRPDALPRLIESFFLEHLQRVRGVSPHTVRAYRDALKLFFNFVADRKGRSVAALRLDDLRVDHVVAFLGHIESERGNCAATRNGRLAAIRGLFGHLLRNDPTRADQYQRVLALPAKRAKMRPPTYLEPEEARVLLRMPDRRMSLGARDHALLLFLYNTGARISEALAIRPAYLHLDRPPHVRLHGKGNRERICPLWRETVSALKDLLRRQPPGPDGTLFRSARGVPLSRDGRRTSSAST